MLKPKAKNEKLGSGCGSVGRTVACDTRGLRSKSNHWSLLFSSNCFEKKIIKKNNWPNVTNKDISTCLENTPHQNF